MKNKSVVIVGAGASGLLCAIFCARKSLKVDVFEQNAKVANKILVSGNGRCNISNTNLNTNDYFSNNYAFVKPALDNFGYKEIEKFCLSIGLILETKNDGRIYPLSNEAKSVVALLLSEAKKLSIKIHLNYKITDIKKLASEYDSIVIATGSLAGSHLGGNNDGLEFAKEFSHNIITPYPSLVQLHLNSNIAPKMSGSKINAQVSLFINNKLSIISSGDVLFTSYGVSGFAILDISQSASVALHEYAKVDISINLLPAYNAQKLSNHILKMASLTGESKISEILSGLIPIKISIHLLESLNIDNSTLVKNIGVKLSKKIANTMLNWRFEVSDTHGFRYGEVAGGGVDTEEVNPQTMESLKKTNLYFTGEVLDVLGRRGGYNFAFAWASAYLASKHITTN
jgi:predicted Rossmann fold flavoprotein